MMDWTVFTFPPTNRYPTTVEYKCGPFTIVSDQDHWCLVRSSRKGTFVRYFLTLEEAMQVAEKLVSQEAVSHQRWAFHFYG